MPHCAASINDASGGVPDCAARAEVTAQAWACARTSGTPAARAAAKAASHAAAAPRADSLELSSSTSCII